MHNTMHEIIEMKNRAIALLKEAPMTDSNIEALNRLSDKDLKFAGQASVEPYENVDELIRTYKLRLINCKRRGLTACGIQDFIDALENMDSSERIVSLPFFSDDYAVTLFVSDRNLLVGCVTVPRNA